MKLKKAFFTRHCAIVTGASSGIGKEIARILMRDYGMTVVGVARNKDRLYDTQKEFENYVENGGRFVPFSLDVSNYDEILFIKQFMIENNFKVNLVVSAAGQIHDFTKFENLNENDIERIIKVNELGTINLAKAFLPELKQSKEKVGFVTIASSSSIVPVPGASLYSCSKAGIKAFTECLIAENDNKKLYIGVMMPGMTKTSLFDSAGVLLPEKYVKLMTKPDVMAKKIVKAIKRCKKRAVFGTDAHLMRFGYACFGGKFTRLMKKIMIKCSIIHE